MQEHSSLAEQNMGQDRSEVVMVSSSCFLELRSPSPGKAGRETKFGLLFLAVVYLPCLNRRPYECHFPAVVRWKRLPSMSAVRGVY